MSLKIRFKNTLTGNLDEFQPLAPGKVSMYTCGPTVYNFAHIGNFRAYIFEDLLRRFLQSAGFSVTQIMNITDIDDKTIRDSKACGKSLKDFTENYTQAFFEDLKSLNIEPAEMYPRATDHIPEMINLIKILCDKNLTYQKDGSTYFRITDFKEYGKLSGIDLDNVKTGLRYDTDEYEKDDVRDFVLWKACEEGEPSWESPFGAGRPGWHIECSAMGMKYLGKTFDIHTGGVDNIFPHHENEIAQSEAATGKKFVNYWLHCEHLIVENRKMSKSAGNFFTLRDLTSRGFDPLAVRYLLLSAHYRSKLNFTMEGLEQSEKLIRKIADFYLRLSEAVTSERDGHDFENVKSDFLSALADDLNISAALAVFHQFMKDVNELLMNGISSSEKKSALDIAAFLNSVLGFIRISEISIPESIARMAEKRFEARKNRDFKLSDQLRDDLLKAGYRVEDSRDSYRVVPV